MGEVGAGEVSTGEVGAEREGHSAISYGSPNQGLTPVNCTEFGDLDSSCVFSNHCACSEGCFRCEQSTQWLENNECGPGSRCIPDL